MSLRAVRSPLAPMMTMEHGSTVRRPVSRRQLISSSRFSRLLTGPQIAPQGGAWQSRFARRFMRRAHNHREQNSIYFGPPPNIVVALVADVAELADALDSKSGIRKDVWV